MKRVSALFVMIGFSMLGNTSLVVQPMIVGALVDQLHFTVRQAGFVASVELAGLSLGTLTLIGFGTRLRRRTLGIAAVATVVIVNVASCAVHDFELMMLLRFIGGVGGAMGLAVFLTMGASQPRPENTFAIVNAVSIAYSGVFTPFAPGVLATWGLSGLFLILALIALVMLVLIPGIIEFGQSTGATSPPAEAIWSPLHVGMLLAMMLLLYTGHGAIWAFQERIGTSLGMTAQTVGTSIGMSMLIGGVGGSLLARGLGLKFGRVWPQLTSLGISAVAAILLVNGHTPALFALACGLVALSWFYGLPYQMGLLAKFDPKGRANMAGLVMTTGGASVGPALAAILLGVAGYDGIGLFAAGCYVLSLLLVLPAAMALNATVRPQLT